MTVSVFLRIQAADFNKWLNPDPNNVDQMLKGQGALAHSLHRNLEDPNEVISYMQFADEAAAASFKSWFNSVAGDWHTIQEGGDQEIKEWWFGSDVPGYSSQP